MGRRVLIGCLALLAVAWPAFAQVPRPKPVLHAAAPSPPPAPESPAPASASPETAHAPQSAAAAALPGAAIPAPPPATGPLAFAPTSVNERVAGAFAVPMPELKPDVSPDGPPGAAAPPLPPLAGTKAPRPADEAPAVKKADEAKPATADTATADPLETETPRPKPKITRVAARAPQRERTPTNSSVHTSIRAAQLDPGEGAACEAALSKRATYTLKTAVRDNSCGAPRPLAVSAVEGVQLSGSTTLRCPVATALADWTKDVVHPAAKKHFKQDIAAYLLGPTYACRRRRNGSRTTRLSEHAFANAVDIAGFRLKDGTVVMVEPHHGGAAKAFQAEVRQGACGTFKTVLGPRTTPLHDDHLHLDSAPRGNGSTYCK